MQIEQDAEAAIAAHCSTAQQLEQARESAADAATTVRRAQVEVQQACEEEKRVIVEVDMQLEVAARTAGMWLDYKKSVSVKSGQSAAWFGSAHDESDAHKYRDRFEAPQNRHRLYGRIVKKISFSRSGS